jgi:hypothetical protein
MGRGSSSPDDVLVSCSTRRSMVPAGCTAVLLTAFSFALAESFVEALVWVAILALWTYVLLLWFIPYAVTLHTDQTLRVHFLLHTRIVPGPSIVAVEPRRALFSEYLTIVPARGRPLQLKETPAAFELARGLVRQNPSISVDALTKYFTG